MKNPVCIVVQCEFESPAPRSWRERVGARPPWSVALPPLPTRVPEPLPCGFFRKTVLWGMPLAHPGEEGGQVQGRDGSWPEDSLMNDGSQAHTFKLWTGSFSVWTVCFPAFRWDHGGVRIWGHVSCKRRQPLPCFSLRKESQEDEESRHVHCCNTLSVDLPSSVATLV